jgi:hypothetical protein
MSRIFISHSSRDDKRAIEVIDWLAANGWDDVFLDLDPIRGLAPGERWQNALKAAADRCEAVLFLISENWLNSRWCLSEYLLAKQLGKRLFPVIIENVDLSALPADITADHQTVHLVLDPHGWERLKQGLKRAGLDANSFSFPAGRRPYPGFEPLTEEDAAVFFGRDAQVLRALDHLRLMRDAGAERVLVVLGASGAGKSSFLRAGLWPRLQRDDHNFWPLPVIRPERAVLTGRSGLHAALEGALVDKRLAQHPALASLPRSRASLGNVVSRDGLAGLLMAMRVAASAPLEGDASSPPTLVLCVDQAEELLNAEGRPEAERFLELLAIALDTDRQLLAILSIRSDAYPQLQADSRLAGIAREPFDLPPILEGSLRSVIEGPAQLAVPPLKPEPAFVDAILEDATGQDALPLLAFTLNRVAREYGADGILTVQNYRTSGGIRGAITAAVDEALASGRDRGLVPRDEKSLVALLRQAFVPHLARVNEAGEFARRVASADEIPAPARPLIDLLVEARLLTRDRGEQGEVTEVAHEALLREWPLLRHFLEADREFLIGKRQLADDLAIWRAAPLDRKGDALLSGFRLTRAQHWLAERASHELTREERNFIGESVRAAQSRQRWRTRAVFAAILLLACFSAVAAWQWNRATKAAAVAELNAAEATTEKTRADQSAAMALQNAAEARAEKARAEQSATEAKAEKLRADQSAADATSRQAKIISKGAEGVLQTGDSTTAALLALEAIRVARLTRNGPIVEPEVALREAIGHSAEIDYFSETKNLFLTDTGRYINLVSPNKIQLFETQTRTRREVMAPGATVTSISECGPTYFAVGSDDGWLTIVDYDTTKSLLSLNLDAIILSIACVFDGGAMRVIAALSSNKVAIINASTFVVERYVVGQNIIHVSASRRHDAFETHTTSNELRLFDVKTGTMIATIPSFVGIGPYALNEDGRFVAFSNATVPSLINVFDVGTKKIIPFRANTLANSPLFVGFIDARRFIAVDSRGSGWIAHIYDEKAEIKANVDSNFDDDGELIAAGLIGKPNTSSDSPFLLMKVHRNGTVVGHQWDEFGNKAAGFVVRSIVEPDDAQIARQAGLILMTNSQRKHGVLFRVPDIPSFQREKVCDGPADLVREVGQQLYVACRASEVQILESDLLARASRLPRSRREGLGALTALAALPTEFFRIDGGMALAGSEDGFIYAWSAYPLLKGIYKKFEGPIILVDAKPSDFSISAINAQGRFIMFGPVVDANVKTPVSSMGGYEAGFTPQNTREICELTLPNRIVDAVIANDRIRTLTALGEVIDVYGETCKFELVSRVPEQKKWLKIYLRSKDFIFVAEGSVCKLEGAEPLRCIDTATVTNRALVTLSDVDDKLFLANEHGGVEQIDTANMRNFGTVYLANDRITALYYSDRLRQLFGVDEGGSLFRTSDIRSISELEQEARTRLPRCLDERSAKIYLGASVPEECSINSKK